MLFRLYGFIKINLCLAFVGKGVFQPAFRKHFPESVSFKGSCSRRRREALDYSAPGLYFITVCIANRERILWNDVGADTIRPQNAPLSDIGKIVEQGILQIPEHYVNISVDKYCVMPDHVHLIVRVEEKNGRMISAPDIQMRIPHGHIDGSASHSFFRTMPLQFAHYFSPY